MARTKKQLQVPGTENRKIKELDTAAESYVEARDKRMAHTELETETREALIAVMKKHSLTVYKDDDAVPPFIITLTPGKDKVKVTRDEGDDGDSEEDVA